MDRGDIWISAVIYIGLGVIAITLLIAAGIPLIEKMRDRNTFLQTKEVMHTLDRTVYDVVSEGPGSQRYLNPLEINGGFLSVPLANRGFFWTMETEAILQEPGATIQEGHLKITQRKDPLIVDLYHIDIVLQQYAQDKIFIYVNGGEDAVLTDLHGTFGLSISNYGIINGRTVVNIDYV